MQQLKNGNSNYMIAALHVSPIPRVFNYCMYDCNMLLYLALKKSRF